MDWYGWRQTSDPTGQWNWVIQLLSLDGLGGLSDFLDWIYSMKTVIFLGKNALYLPIITLRYQVQLFYPIVYFHSYKNIIIKGGSVGSERSSGSIVAFSILERIL